MEALPLIPTHSSACVQSAVQIFAQAKCLGRRGRSRYLLVQQSDVYNHCSSYITKIMKTLAILGATGQTGLHLVAQALNKGHTVKALVRNEEKLKTALEKEQNIKDHENLQVVKISNIFDADELKGPLENVDVVMSTLGFGRGST